MKSLRPNLYHVPEVPGLFYKSFRSLYDKSCCSFGPRTEKIPTKIVVLISMGVSRRNALKGFA